MLISIITVNLNNKEGLERTAQSIINQTCKDYEWIVIDGGSTDGSIDVIKKYIDYLAYWVSEPDNGIYNAMNKGILVARGDYLNFMNSGDAFYDDRVLEKLNNNGFNFDVIYGNTAKVDGEKIVSYLNTPPFLDRLSYLWTHFLNHQSTFISKRCFEDQMYNEDLKIAADYEHFFKLMYKGYSFGKFEYIIARFDIHGISSSLDLENEAELARLSVLPPAIINDYQDILQFRDVDLYLIFRRIVNSNRFFRYMTRLLLYPIYQLILLLRLS